MTSMQPSADHDQRPCPTGARRAGRRRIPVPIAVVVAGALAVMGLVPAATGSAAVPGDTSGRLTSYEASVDAIVNPERGFYFHRGDCDEDAFDRDELIGFREDDHVGLVMCIFYLEDFKSGRITKAALAHLDRQLETVREAGLKTILRFAYTKSSDGDDASLRWIKIHLNQLGPVLARNSDVIAVMQSGFVGAWGEGYYTQHFGDRGEISDAQWADRKAVVDKIMSVLPRNRMVQVRTLLMKQKMVGSTPVGPGGAYTGSPRARTGHHNDCFLSENLDQGTYLDPEEDYPYLAADSTYVVVGGETCQVYPPRSECPTALEELELFHYSYLNADYHPGVLDGWRAGGCMAEVERRLGYRFALVSSSFPGSARRGSTMPVELTVRNDGWSTPYNPRLVRLVLRSASTGTVYKTMIKTDPRFWSAGEVTTVDTTVQLPAGMPRGSYELLLNLADPADALRNRPEYAMRLANVGLWEPETGYNDLETMIEIT